MDSHQKMTEIVGGAAIQALEYWSRALLAVAKA